MLRREFWLGALLISGAFTACVTNHDALEKKPAGRAGSSGGGATGLAGGPTQVGGTGGEAATAGGHADDEPPGASVLTFVNGIVDAPRVALCLAKVDAEGNVTPFGSPLTDEPLEYGQSLVLAETADVDVATDGLQPFVIAGELDLIADLDCEAAIARARAEEATSDASGDESGQGGAGGDGSSLGVAGAVAEGGSAGSVGAAGSAGAAANAPAVRSPLRVRGLPAIAAGTLNAGRSLVFVANGCLGGATYDGAKAELYCGTGYTPRQPTASAILVSLSRQVVGDHLGMQVVHASLANGPVDLRSRPLMPPSDPGVVITSVRPGQVQPRPASVSATAFDLGVARNYKLEVLSQGTSLFAQGWPRALSLGGLGELEDGKGYALVLSGPSGGSKAVPNLWNGPVLTAIAASPE